METKMKTSKSTKSAAPSTSASTSAKSAAPTPPPPPAPTPAPSPEASQCPPKVEDAIQSPEEFVNEKFEYINTKIVDMSTTLKGLQNFVKVLQKDLAKALKSAKRTKGKGGGGNSGAKKTPSGFAKPTKLSNALCDFLAVGKGTEMARTDVTRLLNEYIKSQGLQDKEDKRTIHPDAKLTTILSLQPGEKLTFFNLQKYIKHNFVKATP
jgi:chromatin remodeling complex protein RSC6